MLTRQDTAAVAAALGRESFEGLRAQHLLLAPRGGRAPEAAHELAAIMAVTQLFRNMSQDMREQVRWGSAAQRAEAR